MREGLWKKKSEKGFTGRHRENRINIRAQRYRPSHIEGGRLVGLVKFRQLAGRFP